MTAMPTDIAIVGMAGCYAGADSARAFWQNILNKVDAVAPASAEWTGPYLDTESGRNDRIYTNNGGFLRESAVFNPAEFGIMPSSIDGGEPDHYLALKLARDALNDAGYSRGDYDPERSGVILGRGTYVNRGYGTIMQHGQVLDQTLEALRVARPDLSDTELNAVRDALKAQLPGFNAEMTPGLVPNVTTGIIANRLDLMGPNYIIDAACASSLISVELAARELHSGRCSMVLAGGVQAHTPPQLFMVFCQINALSRGKIRPFSAEAGGTLLGEGAGMLVLKRLADAQADGDNIYAVIKGVGTASDGRAKGMLAPRFEGEVLALKRAYESSGVDPRSVGLVEAHGTGIKLGDQTEVASLGEVYGGRDSHAPRVALGSVKSMISHCIPAAGSAALIKSALALHHKVLPPTLCESVNPELHLESTPFYINTETRPWSHGLGTPRRAGVNAFGFGGINAHVVLEEHRPTASHNRVTVPAGMQWHAPAAELLIFAADDVDGLIGQVDATIARLQAKPAPHLGGLALLLAQQAESRTAETDAAALHRLALTASDADDAVKQLEKARERLAAGKSSFRTRTGLYAGNGAMPGRMAFVFPGEGAQYSGMLSELAVAYPQVRSWFDFLDRTFSADREYRPSEAILPPPTGLSEAQRKRLDDALYDMDLASESVFATSLALHALVETAGIVPEIMVGHSTGENSALVASNTMVAEDIDGVARFAQDFNAIYREVEAAGSIHVGSLLTVGALDAERRAQLLADDDVLLAMDNCPNQAVYFGSPEAIEAAHKKLSAEGGICSELPFGRAYHTPHFAPVADAFRGFYAGVDMRPGSAQLYSCATAAPFPGDADAIRDTACGQWAQPVRFVDTVERLYADGVRVFVEIGPSANLSAFIGDILKGRDAVAVSTNSRRQADVGHFHGAMAQLWALGCPMQPSALMAHRDLPPESLDIPDAPKRPVQFLNLQLPAIRLTADMLPERAPQQFAAPQAADTQPAVRATDTATNTDTHSRTKTGPVPTTAPPAQASTWASTEATAAGDDPRAALVRGHFDLMSQFLDSQQRIWAAAGGTARTAAPATATPAAAGGDANVTSSSADAFPLLGEVLESDAEHLVTAHVISLDRDVFLNDHTLGGVPTERDASIAGLPVVPFTFSMEILAEAAARFIGPGQRVIGIDGARGHRWLSLDDGTLPLRIKVQRGAEAGSVEGRIFLDRPGSRMPGGVLVFEGTVRFAESYPAAPEAIEWTATESRAATQNPEGQLYDFGMFHGPRLHGVKRILRWADEAIEGELEVLPTHDYFRHAQAPAFQFDAALLDAVGQLAGFWISERFTWSHNCFPFRVGHFRLYADTPPTGTRLLCRARIGMTGETSLRAAFDVLLPDGRLLARAEGWDDRTFTVPQRVADFRLAPTQRFLSEAAVMPAPEGWVLRHIPAFDDGFLDEAWGIWRHMLAHLVLNHTERAQFYALPAQGPRQTEWLLGRIAAKECARLWISEHHGIDLAGADVEITVNAAGAPGLSCPALGTTVLPAISIAHAHGHAVACAAPPGLQVGIDYQRGDGVNLHDVAASALSEADIATVGRSDAASILALWCAKEAAAKAAGSGLDGRPKDWQVQRATLDAHGRGSVDILHAGMTTSVLLSRLEGNAHIGLAARAGTSPEHPPLPHKAGAQTG